MKDKGKIGIFDSGIGGITVLNEIIKILPNEQYIYYSDSKNNPYGDKTNEEVIQICEHIVDYLLQEGCKIIVIACNTASTKAVLYLRNKYKDISFIAIEPAYKMVYDYAYDKETLVMATKGTIESERFNLLYAKYNNHKTHLIPCVGLADIIESGSKEELKVYLEKTIGEFQGKVKNVVLGCTHYPLVKEQIKEVLGEVTFFNGAKHLAKHLKDVLIQKDLLEEKTFAIQFVDTNNQEEKKERFFSLLQK